MRSMEPAETRTFLEGGTRTGKLAVLRRDGSPHVVPIWFVVDEANDDIVFMTGATTLKGRALRRDPRVSLCVDDEAPPFSFVRVDGTVVVSEDPEERLRWSLRIAHRYMGPELAEEYGRRNAVPGELLVRLHLARVVARAGIAD
jgi:PPOX class probable F420-dependent enzyme